MTRLAIAIASIALSAVQRPAADSNQWIALGRAGIWVAVDASTGSTRRLDVPPPYQVNELVLSHDGRFAAFTAKLPEQPIALLYAWDTTTGNVRSVGDRVGYHSAPSLSLDGQWIYFAHHPEAGGPPGAHGDKAYAQIYRVRRDGSQLEALTAENGCHITPVSPGGDTVYFVHSNCGRQRILRSLRGTTPSALKLDLGSAEQLSLSPDGRYLAVLLQGVETVRAVELDLEAQAWTPRVLFDAAKVGHTGVLRHGRRPREAFLVQGEHLLWLRGDKACDLGPLDAPPRTAMSVCSSPSSSAVLFPSHSGASR